MMCKGKKCIFAAVLPSTNCNYMVGSQKTDNSSSSGGKLGKNLIIET